MFFLVKINMMEQTDEARMMTTKLVVPAISYTDAEASAMQVYEDCFKDTYDTPDIKTITTVSFNAKIDTLTTKEAKDAVTVALSHLFNVKVNLRYTDSPKVYTKVYLVRATKMSEAVTASQEYSLEHVGANISTVVSVNQTDYNPVSPIFKESEDE